jgi:glycosyltransferase involved in cell wall biosynthesis
MVKPVVVRNCSRNADHITSYSRDNLNVSQGDLLVIIQGTGINIDKGAEELIDAVNILDGVALLVVGSGDVVPQLVQQVKELKIGHKVKFIPAGSWETLMKYTKTADMGMCLEKDTNLNYRYSLPNKLFNYISAGIPVISSDLQEIKKIIEQYNFGIVIPSVTPEEISKAILKLKNDPELLNKLKQNAVTASEKLNWENESKRVTAFYGNVINDVLNKYK